MNGIQMTDEESFTVRLRILIRVSASGSEDLAIMLTKRLCWSSGLSGLSYVTLVSDFTSETSDTSHPWDFAICDLLFAFCFIPFAFGGCRRINGFHLMGDK